ncbi:hypothetical protein AXG93_312s1010 [Marchantia polymorpha subsp. ruderalis]|uniref:Uncharacterized protein n=1 Tax=Marchantia polymorpha subsp. ruderalis TaxID=1480154 RepID=A0A176W878_MARPO|nr:hypothetical protein AXG93_312s1010 [Marchantia polymorpha subsp. ruderalis]
MVPIGELVIMEEFGCSVEDRGFTQSGLRYRLIHPSASVVAEARGVADSESLVVMSSSVSHSLTGDMDGMYEAMKGPRRYSGAGLFQHLEWPPMDDYHEFGREYAVEIDAWRRHWSSNYMSITQGGVDTRVDASGSIIEGTCGVAWAGTSSGAVSVASSSTSGKSIGIPLFSPIPEFFKRLRKNYKGVSMEKLRSLQEFERKTGGSSGGIHSYAAIDLNYSRCN